MDATITRSIENLAREMSQLRVTQYTATAGTVVYFYDYFLTLGDEITLFWKTSKKIALVRILYIVTRYFPGIGLLCAMRGIAPFLTQMTVEMCRLTMYGAAVCTIATTTATAIFCIRMYTLYPSSPVMRISLVVSFWVSVVLQMGFASIALVMLNPILRVVDNECTASGPNSSMMQYFMATSVLAPLVCEITIVFSMLKHAMDRSTYLDPRDGSPLLRRLYADGALYFAYVLTLRVSSCLVWFLTPIQLKPMFDYPNFALTSTLTCRFALALRLAANPPLPTSMEGVGGTVPEFAAAVGTGNSSCTATGVSGAGAGAVREGGSRTSGGALRKSSHGHGSRDPMKTTTTPPTETFWMSSDEMAAVVEEDEEAGDGKATPSPSSAHVLNRYHICDHRCVFGEDRKDDNDGDGTSNEDFELSKLDSSMDRKGIGDT